MARFAGHSFRCVNPLRSIHSPSALGQPVRPQLGHVAAGQPIDGADQVVQRQQRFRPSANAGTERLRIGGHGSTGGANVLPGPTAGLTDVAGVFAGYRSNAVLGDGRIAQSGFVPEFNRAGGRRDSTRTPILRRIAGLDWTFPPQRRTGRETSTEEICSLRMGVGI
jgi:hypothetical protein